MDGFLALAHKLNAHGPPLTRLGIRGARHCTPFEALTSSEKKTRPGERAGKVVVDCHNGVCFFLAACLERDFEQCQIHRFYRGLLNKSQAAGAAISFFLLTFGFSKPPPFFFGLSVESE